MRRRACGGAGGVVKLGSAIGAEVGGITYGMEHSYTFAYLSAAGLAVMAAIAVLAIRDRPRYREAALRLDERR